MNTRLLLPLALLLTAGCAQKDTVSLDDTGSGGPDDSNVTTDDSSATDDSGADDSSATDDSSASDCEVTIVSVDPSDGAEDISTEPGLTASLSGEVNEGDVSATLTGPEGEVPGAVTVERAGTRVRFTPDDELARSSEYTISFTVCQDEATASFLTVGEPLGNILEGRVYDVDLTQVTWSQPPNGALLAGFLESAHLLFSVEAVDSDAETIDFVGALGRENPDVEQDICTDPFDFDPADFSSDPAFQVGPTDTAFEASGYALNVYELRATGAFSATGNNLRNMRVQGYIDISDFEIQGAQACDYAEFLLSAPCLTCPNGDEGCLELDVESSSAPWLEGVTVDPNNNPADHAECN
ncbi:MAG: Ig-like domain-containing protein [Alphaproteobacteria bacterium]|nr:Ig-like domain-containing protein [Alphaproteobacteria bacterium]